MSTKVYDSDVDWASGAENHIEHADGKLTLVSGQNEGTWIVDFDSEIEGCGWGNFWWTGRTLLDVIFKNTIDVEFKNTSDVIWKSEV